MVNYSVRIFLIGPAGVGKTTVGKVLAAKLGFTFVDQDLEHMTRIGDIGKHIEQYGYSQYFMNNSTLFEKLLSESRGNVVMALSSGFLAHEEFENLIQKHKKLIQDDGISVLLLPSKSISKSAVIIATRQLDRWHPETPKELREIEIQKGIQRFIPRYKSYYSLGNIKVFSVASPEMIARLIYAKLKKHI